MFKTKLIIETNVAECNCPEERFWTIEVRLTPGSFNSKVMISLQRAKQNFFENMAAAAVLF